MFSSPTLSRCNKQQSGIDMMTTKRIIDEQSQTIEQLKAVIDELKVRHERRERELTKRVGALYHDLQLNKRKMAHLLYKHQQQKKLNEGNKLAHDFSTQTDGQHLSSTCPSCSTQISDTSQSNDNNIVQRLSQLQVHDQHKDHEQQPKYYTLQAEVEDAEYISATPQATFNQPLSSPALSTTDRSSTRSSCSHHHCSTSSTNHNESSSSAYNTAESLPSSTYSDEIESLERVLNAACTMYTTHDNLEHTIKLQEELFRQRLRLRGIAVDENHNESSSSEHLYDNIDGETSDREQQITAACRTRPMSSHRNKSKQNNTFSTDDDEQHQHERMKIPKANKVRFNEQYHPSSKRRSVKATPKVNPTKPTNSRRYHSTTSPNKKFSLPLSPNMLTVTIT